MPGQSVSLARSVGSHVRRKAMHRAARIGIMALVVILVGLVAQPARAEAPPLPASMAAIGDSITRAYDVC
jgi:hypothetical protein